MTQPEADVGAVTAQIPNRADLLDYVADMIGELHALAKQAECATLAGLLELARMEAAQQGSAAHRDKLRRVMT